MGEGVWGVNFLHPKIGSESTHSIFCKMGNMGYCRLKKDGEEVVQGLLKLSKVTGISEVLKVDAIYFRGFP